MPWGTKITQVVQWPCCCSEKFKWVSSNSVYSLLNRCDTEGINRFHKLPRPKGTPSLNLSPLSLTPRIPNTQQIQIWKINGIRANDHVRLGGTIFSRRCFKQIILFRINFRPKASPFLLLGKLMTKFFQLVWQYCAFVRTIFSMVVSLEKRTPSLSNFNTIHMFCN